VTISRRLALVAALVAVSATAAADGWRTAAPDRAWSFPRDHWAHPGFRSEWWYFTGHLRADDDAGREFGFQFTVFRVGLLPERPDLDSAWSTDALILGHASIGDLVAGEHRFSEVLRRTTPFLGEFATYPQRPIAWVRAPAGTDDRWEVDWDGSGFSLRMRDDVRGMAFDLAAIPSKPLVLHGPNGYSRKAAREGAASQYYGYTRLGTAGSLTLDGRTWRVAGTAWMDKEFSSGTLTGEQVGWDWFSLQLDDGRDLMLFALRRADGAIDFASGTRVAPDGAARPLAAGDWSASVRDRWTSPATGATYPSRWTVAVPSEGLVLDVVPRFADQENVSPATGGVHYWEGAVELRDADGRTVGRGYVELTGYGEGSRPPV